MELSNKEIIRINETVNMIPQDVSSILELGCGDGRILRALPDKVHGTGIDIDSVRIKLFPGNKIIGDISKLPIKSMMFDMVLCCEVLEHLDDKALFFVLEEIQRVAKKYILITVPFKETLSAQWRKCCECSFVFHAWGHVRRFDLALLKSLFRNVQLKERRFLGSSESRIPSLAYIIAKRMGNVWDNDSGVQSRCPKCGFQAIRNKGNVFGWVFIRFLWRVERIWPFKKPIWIGCLYRISKKRDELTP